MVHIASHFRFKPGNNAESFLLLGDGGHLSMADLQKSANLFGGVQLLTLSAEFPGRRRKREWAPKYRRPPLPKSIDSNASNPRSLRRKPANAQFALPGSDPRQ